MKLQNTQNIFPLSTRQLTAKSEICSKLKIKGTEERHLILFLISLL